MEITVDLDLTKLTILCFACNRDLHVTERNGEVLVDICQTCQSDAEQAGYYSGHSDGYAEGYDTGCADGKAEAEEEPSK